MQKAIFTALLWGFTTQLAHAQYQCPKNPTIDPSLLFGIYRDSLQPDQIVWSDDGREFLGSLLSFRERRPFLPYGTTDKKDFCHRLFVINSLPTGQHPLNLSRIQYLTPYRPGQIGRSFYMRQANYVIVENLLTSQDKVHWEKIDADGTITLIAAAPYDSYWSTSFVPSPNGQYILRTDSWGEPVLKPKDPSEIAVPPSKQLNLTVAILDAQTLQPLFPAQDFFGITFGYSASWTRSDLVEIADQEKTTIIDPATGNIDNSSQSLECYGPVTTSSFVNDRGQFVVLDQINKKALVTVSQAGEGIGFGCE